MIRYYRCRQLNNNKKILIRINPLYKPLFSINENKEYTYNITKINNLTTELIIPYF